MEEKPKGRPKGKTYPHVRSIKLREEDMRRLRALAQKLDRDQSWVIRQAVLEMAKREKVE